LSLHGVTHPEINFEPRRQSATRDILEHTCKIPDTGACSSGLHGQHSSDVAVDSVSSHLQDAGDAPDWLGDVATLSQVLAAARRRRDYALRQATGSIQRFAQQTLWQNALQVLVQIQREEIQLDVTTYNAVLRACLQGQQWAQVLHLLSEMRETGVRPDENTYSDCLHACSIGQQWAKALELASELQRRGLTPNKDSQAALISVCADGRQWEQALVHLAELVREGLRPNLVSYSALISAHGTAHQWEHALDLLSDMRANIFRPCVSTYNVVIRACEAGEQWERVLRLMAQMRQIRLMPDETTYNISISACCTCQQWGQSLRLLAEMLQNGFKPDGTTHETLVRACLMERKQGLEDTEAASSVATNVVRTGMALARGSSPSASMVGDARAMTPSSAVCMDTGVVPDATTPDDKCLSSWQAVSLQEGESHGNGMGVKEHQGHEELSNKQEGEEMIRQMAPVDAGCCQVQACSAGNRPWLATMLGVQHRASLATTSANAAGWLWLCGSWLWLVFWWLRLFCSSCVDLVYELWPRRPPGST